jgi:hypothetical protein
MVEARVLGIFDGCAGVAYLHEPSRGVHRQRAALDLRADGGVLARLQPCFALEDALRLKHPPQAQHAHRGSGSSRSLPSTLRLLHLGMRPRHQSTAATATGINSNGAFWTLSFAVLRSLQYIGWSNEYSTRSANGCISRAPALHPPPAAIIYSILQQRSPPLAHAATNMLAHARPPLNCRSLRRHAAPVRRFRSYAQQPLSWVTGQHEAPTTGFEAIVVLAGGLTPDGGLPEWVTRRLDAACDLHMLQPSRPTILCLGEREHAGGLPRTATPWGLTLAATGPQAPARPTSPPCCPPPST